MEEVYIIFHSKTLVLVRKGRAFYATLYQEVFFGNPGGGGSLIPNAELHVLQKGPGEGVIYLQISEMCIFIHKNCAYTY